MGAGNKKLIKQAGIFLIVFIVAFFGTKYLMSKIKPNYELEKISADINKKGSVMIDAETRLETSSVSGDTLKYIYTLVNVTKEDTTFDGKGAQQFIRTNAQHNLDTDSRMSYYREKKIRLKYLYKDKNGKDLFNFTINTK